MNNTSKAHLYLIHCHTNMHAGSGDESYGIIDKQVQRDSATGIPCIHASSLKGALREHFEGKAGYPPKEIDDNSGFGYVTEDNMMHIFGTLPNEKDGNNKAGNYIFFPANLLSIPVRSSYRPYYNATSRLILEDVFDLNLRMERLLSPSVAKALKDFNDSQGSPLIFDGAKHVILESKEASSYETLEESNLSKVKEWIGENPALFSPEDFMERSNELPVIARNHLENGISQNLWYEEVIPRETRFYCVILSTPDDKIFELFNNVLTRDLIQIGANATVGYGYCSFTKLS